MPIAALVGVVATQPVARHRSVAVRLLPALAVCALLAVAGTPVCTAQHVLADRPRGSATPYLAAARALAAAAATVARAHTRGAQPDAADDDGPLTAVAPRYFYTRSLPATPEARLPEPLLLWLFVIVRLRPDVRSERLVAALRAMGMDIACVREQAARSRGLLLDAGYGRSCTSVAIVRRTCRRGPVSRDGAALDRPARELGALAVLGTRRRRRSGRTSRADGS